MVGRGAYALARVAVMVRTAARWLWWTGVLAAVGGVFVPGFTGRRIGLLAGAAAFLIAAVVTFAVRAGRYTALADASTKAAKAVVLQDRGVTARLWIRRWRWWLLLALLVAVGSSVALPAAGGLLMAGAGAGLWAKSVRIGRWERAHEALLWVRPEWTRRGPAGKAVKSYLRTGPVAGDARPGGARRRLAPA